MFKKEHFTFIQNFENHVFYNSCIVKYNLFEDNLHEKKNKMQFYNKMIRKQNNNDNFLMKSIRNSLTKNIHTPIYYVIRIINKKKIAMSNKISLLGEEYDVRKDIRHPFLVNFIDSFQDKKNLYYITEFASGGFFFFHLWKRNFLTKYETVFYIAEIILALQYLHSKNLLYRSLFPSNILISASGHIKLKFDLLNKQGINNKELKENMQYIPYDYFKDGDLGPESDFWVVGALLVEMLTGQSPFADLSIEQTRYNIMCKKITRIDCFDTHTMDFICILLDRNRLKRRNICIKHPFYIQNHPFFEGLDWQALELKKIQPPLTFDHQIPIPKLYRNFSEVFTTDYRENETDGYHNTFEYYKGGQFKKFRPW